jgi:hypothetical protein
MPIQVFPHHLTKKTNSIMTKQITSILLTAVLALSLVACQTTGKTENKAEGDMATNEAPVAAPAAAQQPTKPDWQEKAESAAATTVEWASMEFNYGSVPTGTKVTHQFRFTNTGSEPLILTRVKASCGCTTPSYSTEPVAPGADGFIDVAFNTTGKQGVQNKSVTVTGNFDGNTTQMLRISGEVTPAEAQ